MVNQNYETSLPSFDHSSKAHNKAEENQSPADEEATALAATPTLTPTLTLTLTDKLLGKGSSSEVFLGYDSKTQEKMAIKAVNLKKLSANSKVKLQREIEILTKLRSWSSSSRFVRLEKVFAEESSRNEKLYLAMEYVPGCDLFVLCNEYSLGLPETLTKQIFYNIALSIEELHSFQICHLDLKLENIMYNKETNSLKLIDFGFSQFTTLYSPGGQSADSKSRDLPQILQTSFCGSIHYAAPELLSRLPFDGKKADIWSLGVVLFALLTSHFPFDDFHANSSRIFQKIRSKQPNFPPHLSNQQTSLLSMMLEKDPARRCSIEDVIAHPYFTSFRSM